MPAVAPPSITTQPVGGSQIYFNDALLDVQEPPKMIAAGDEANRRL